MKHKSRYHDTPIFAPDPRGNSQFTGVRPREISPAPGIIEHSVSAGERLDRMSDHFFDDSRLWYRIGDANWGFLYAGDMFLSLSTLASGQADILSRRDMVGHTVLIPKAKE